ncbi:hypothetical protein [Streptomyces sp. YGL11-2]|uniref:hypothetical protein n=1 Tax=Streptomyces sp. YGL11-2 TaxID=3414028 RepID=UPI003CE92CB0
MAHYSGDYASATTGGQVVYESRLELARLLLADFDPSVSDVYAQPCRDEWTEDRLYMGRELLVKARSTRSS